MKRLITACLLASSLAVAPNASAGLVELTWTTTASDLTGSIPGIIGEEITTTFTVDNGSSSLSSQTWGTDDFISYKVSGASGWWITSDFIESGSSTFTTDSFGDVSTAANWLGGYFLGADITTSWAGVVAGGWWNNGNNEVVCSFGPVDCVWANDVGLNQVGSSWTATQLTPIPVPAAAWLFGTALLALLGIRRKKLSARKD